MTDKPQEKKHDAGDFENIGQYFQKCMKLTSVSISAAMLFAAWALFTGNIIETWYFIFELAFFPILLAIECTIYLCIKPYFSAAVKFFVGITVKNDKNN